MEKSIKMLSVWFLIHLFFHVSSAVPLSKDFSLDFPVSEHLWSNHAAVILSAAVLGTLVVLFVGCVCCQNKNIKALSYQNGYPNNCLNESSTLQFDNPTEFQIFPPHSAIIDLQPVCASLPGFCEDKVTFEPLPDILPKQQQSAACSSKPAHFSILLKSKTSLHDWFEDPNINFPRDQLQYIKELGCGWFGRVVEGEAQNIVFQNKKSPVVVKILREEASPSEHLHFLHEARPYRDLSHENVIQMLGRCLETDPFLLIMEHSSTDLKSYLIENENSNDALLDERTLLRMACNVASGLCYMHNEGYTHTDVAAHNCYVCTDLVVKIGDYGVAYDIFKDDYYCLGDVAIPLRWLSPESLLCTDATIETKETTKESNVWSFGVVLWELLQYGKLPYSELTDKNVLKKVIIERSTQPSVPEVDFFHKEHIFFIMKECWKPFLMRPDMKKVEDFLTQIYNEKDKHLDSSFEVRWNALQSKTIKSNLPYSPNVPLKFENDFAAKSDIQNSYSDREGFESDTLSSFEMTYEMLPKSSFHTCLSPSLQVLNGSIDELTEKVTSHSNSCMENSTASIESDVLDRNLSDSEFEEKDSTISEQISEALRDLDLVLANQPSADDSRTSTLNRPMESSERTLIQSAKEASERSFLATDRTNNQHSALSEDINSTRESVEPYSAVEISTQNPLSKKEELPVPNIVISESSSAIIEECEEELDSPEHVNRNVTQRSFRFVFKENSGNDRSHQSGDCVVSTNQEVDISSFEDTAKNCRRQPLTSTPLKSQSSSYLDDSFALAPTNSKGDSSGIATYSDTDSAFLSTIENECNNENDRLLCSNDSVQSPCKDAVFESKNSSLVSDVPYHSQHYEDVNNKLPDASMSQDFKDKAICQDSLRGVSEYESCISTQAHINDSEKFNSSISNVETFVTCNDDNTMGNDGSVLSESEIELSQQKLRPLSDNDVTVSVTPDVLPLSDEDEQNVTNVLTKLPINNTENSSMSLGGYHTHSQETNEGKYDNKDQDQISVLNEQGKSKRESKESIENCRNSVELNESEVLDDSNIMGLSFPDTSSSSFEYNSFDHVKGNQQNSEIEDSLKPEVLGNLNVIGLNCSDTSSSSFEYSDSGNLRENKQRSKDTSDENESLQKLDVLRDSNITGLSFPDTSSSSFDYTNFSDISQSNKEKSIIKEVNSSPNKNSSVSKLVNNSNLTELSFSRNSFSSLTFNDSGNLRGNKMSVWENVNENLNQSDSLITDKTGLSFPDTTSSSFEYNNFSGFSKSEQDLASDEAGSFREFHQQNFFNGRLSLHPDLTAEDCLNGINGSLVLTESSYSDNDGCISSTNDYESKESTPSCAANGVNNHTDAAMVDSETDQSPFTADGCHSGGNFDDDPSEDEDEILQINTETDEAIIIDSSQSLIGFVPSRSIELLQELDAMPSVTNALTAVGNHSENSSSMEVNNCDSSSSSPAIEVNEVVSPCESPEALYPTTMHEPYRNFNVCHEVIEEELTDEMVSPVSICSNTSFSSSDVMMVDDVKSEVTEPDQHSPIIELQTPADSDHESKTTDNTDSPYSFSEIEYYSDRKSQQISDAGNIRKAPVIYNGSAHCWEPSLWHSHEVSDKEGETEDVVVIEGEEILAGEDFQTRGLTIEDINKALDQLNVEKLSNGISLNHLSVSQSPSPYSSVESSPCREVYTPDFESDSASGTSCSSTSGSFECIHNKFKDTLDISKAVSDGELSGSSRETSPLKVFSKTWDCHATPTKGVLVSPEKKISQMRKSVSFNEEGPQAVFEYPPASDSSDDGYGFEGARDEFTWKIDYRKFADWDLQAADMCENEMVEIEELDEEPFVRRPASSVKPLNRSMMYTLTGYTEEDLSEDSLSPSQFNAPSNSPEEGKLPTLSETQITELIKCQLNNLAQEENRLKQMQDVLESKSDEYSVIQQSSPTEEWSFSVQETEDDSLHHVLQQGLWHKPEEISIHDITFEDLSLIEEENSLKLLSDITEVDDSSLTIEEPIDLTSNSKQNFDIIPEKSSESYPTECQQDFVLASVEDENAESNSENRSQLKPKDLSKVPDILSQYKNGMSMCKELDSGPDSLLIFDVEKNTENNNNLTLGENVNNGSDSFLSINTDRENILPNPTCSTIKSALFEDENAGCSLENTSQSKTDFVSNVHNVLSQDKNDRAVYKELESGPDSFLIFNVEKITENIDNLKSSEKFNDGLDLFFSDNTEMGKENILSNPSCTTIKDVLFDDNAFPVEVTNQVASPENVNCSDVLDKQVNQTELFNTKCKDVGVVNKCNENEAPIESQIIAKDVETSLHEFSRLEIALKTENCEHNFTNCDELVIGKYSVEEITKVFPENITSSVELTDKHLDSLKFFSENDAMNLDTDNLISEKSVYEIGCNKSESSANSSCNKDNIEDNSTNKVDIEDTKDKIIIESNVDTSKIIKEESSIELKKVEDSNSDTALMKSGMESNCVIVDALQNVKDTSIFVEVNKNLTSEKTNKIEWESSETSTENVDNFQNLKENMAYAVEGLTSTNIFDKTCASSQPADQILIPDANDKLEECNQTLNEVNASSSCIPSIIITPASEPETDDDELGDFLQEQLKFLRDYDSIDEFSVTSKYTSSPFEDVFGHCDQQASVGSNFIEAYNFEFNNGDFYDDLGDSYSNLDTFHEKARLESVRNRSSSLPLLGENIYCGSPEKAASEPDQGIDFVLDASQVDIDPSSQFTQV